jgi:polyisoprenoid-binding protein YceI
MTIAGTKVRAAEITADLSTLSSDKVARDTAIHGQGLETDTFPKSTFTLTAPASLPSAPQQGKAVKTKVRGELSLHGQTNAVTVPVDACWTGSTVKVSGSAPVVLDDYGIDAISTPIVKIDDHGSFELELTFVPA